MEDGYHLGHRVHIYIRERCIVGGVKKFAKLHGPRSGPPLTAFFQPQTAQHVKYRYYVFIIMRSRLRPIERCSTRPLGMDLHRIGGTCRGIINLSLQVPPRIYIHEDGEESSLPCRRSFRILRAVIPAGTNCRAETRCKFSSIVLHARSSRDASILVKIPNAGQNISDAPEYSFVPCNAASRFG